MSENEGSYSDYVKHLSNLMSGAMFLAGFIFTVVTLLLTRLPNPSTVPSQFALLFLTVLFDLFLFVGIFYAIYVVYHCESIPPLSRQIAILNVVLFSAIVLVGFAFPLLFLLWDLLSLAIISGAMWSFFAISVFLFIFRPFQKYRTGEGVSRKTQK